MHGYGEREFVQALVPILIGRLPDPFAPTEEDMARVIRAAGEWAEQLVHLRTKPNWASVVLDADGPAWNEPPEQT